MIVWQVFGGRSIMGEVGVLVGTTDADPRMSRLFGRVIR